MLLTQSVSIEEQGICFERRLQSFSHGFIVHRLGNYLASASFKVKIWLLLFFSFSFSAHVFNFSVSTKSWEKLPLRKFTLVESGIWFLGIEISICHGYDEVVFGHEVVLRHEEGEPSTENLLGFEGVEDGAVMEVGVWEDAIDPPAHAAKLGHGTFLEKTTCWSKLKW